VARLSVSLGSRDGSHPSELDLFLTIRHISKDGKEGSTILTAKYLPFAIVTYVYILTITVLYTGVVGDPVPVAKGWLRLYLRARDTSDAAGIKIIAIRDYLSTDVQPVQLDVVYTTDVEIWPTNVVPAKGSKLVLQVASCDTQGSGIFGHNHPEDRAEGK